MLELGSSGSVRGVSSNGHPYRDPGPITDLAGCGDSLTERVEIGSCLAESCGRIRCGPPYFTRVRQAAPLPV